jgi:hypothetical protein
VAALTLDAQQIEQVLAGVFALRADAFGAALAPGFALVAVAIVLAAGLAESVGQSVVLFANRVKPPRFVFSLVVNALLFAFSYAFLIACTWLVLHYAYRSPVSIVPLATVLAAAYAPLLFAFLAALPYLGAPLLWALQVWHLLAVVVAVAVVAGTGLPEALTAVGLGWLVVAVSAQTFGKPVAVLGERILDAVAGVELASNAQVVVERLRPGAPASSTDGQRDDGDGAALAVRAPKRRGALSALFGVALMAAIAYACAVFLAPVHHVVFGWDAHVPRALRVPLELLWIAVLGVLVAAFMAPLQTLGWWAGWYGDEIDATDFGAPRAGGDAVLRYVVYLDGIEQSSSAYTPDVETFLDALTPRLPAGVRLVRGVMCYSVLNKPLDEDPIIAWFWRFIQTFVSRAAFLGMIVNLRNVLIVAVSADSRYGPLYNYGVAQVVYDALVAHGYRRGSGVPVTLLGYSGGGQMAAGAAAFLKHATDGPVDILSLGGVISGNARILETEHLYHFVGQRDNVERLGPLLFPSRWPVAVLSRWNRARRLGKVSIYSLGPVGHQVPGGMLDPALVLASGQTALDQTLERIDQVLRGRIERSLAATPVAAAQPQDAPLAAGGGWLPVAPWCGRLVLPPLERRSAIDEALFAIDAAPDAALVGRTVALRFVDAAAQNDVVRAATHDVHFGVRAEHAYRTAQAVVPARLDHRQLVGPLESLAGAHPADDVRVALDGGVTAPSAADPVLRVARTPLLVAGSLRGLVRFERESGTLLAVHYDRASAAFAGPREEVRMAPALAGQRDGTAAYAYGERDEDGTFALSALVPRAALRVAANDAIERADALPFLRRRARRAVAAREGGALAVQVGDAPWTEGDAALVVCLCKPAVAYGVATVVRDDLSGDARFDFFCARTAPHDAAGTIAAPADASVHIGTGLPGSSTRDVLLRVDGHDAFLDELRAQLEAMTARYRIGEGSGCVAASMANAGDANRALLAAVRAPGAPPWAVAAARRIGNPVVSARTWSDNACNIESSMDQDLDERARSFVQAWRAFVPRSAGLAVAGAFLRAGAAGWIIETER